MAYEFDSTALDVKRKNSVYILVVSHAISIQKNASYDLIRFPYGAITYQTSCKRCFILVSFKSIIFRSGDAIIAMHYGGNPIKGLQ